MKTPLPLILSRMSATVITALSEKATKALTTELSRPIYATMDEDESVFKAAQALLQKETETGEAIFDRTNSGDQLVIKLCDMP